MNGKSGRRHLRMWLGLRLVEKIINTKGTMLSARIFVLLWHFSRLVLQNGLRGPGRSRISGVSQKGIRCFYSLRS